ncbi:MAG: hypothetical protein FWG70_09845 [Oscillospiraceae bacterium]|nr:hypothetical protein [Oscillospiraceae bacterium]
MKQLFKNSETFPGSVITNNRAFNTVTAWDSYALFAIAVNVFKAAETAILRLYGVGMSIFRLNDCFERLLPCNTA